MPTMTCRKCGVYGAVIQTDAMDGSTVLVCPTCGAAPFRPDAVTPRGRWICNRTGRDVGICTCGDCQPLAVAPGHVWQDAGTFICPVCNDAQARRIDGRIVCGACGAVGMADTETVTAGVTMNGVPMDTETVTNGQGENDATDEDGRGSDGTGSATDAVHDVTRGSDADGRGSDGRDGVSSSGADDSVGAAASVTGTETEKGRTMETLQAMDMSAADLRALIKLAGMRQLDVAQAMHVSQGTVSRRLASGDLLDATGAAIRGHVFGAAVTACGMPAVEARIALVRGAVSPPAGQYRPQVTSNVTPAPAVQPVPTPAASAAPAVTVPAADLSRIDAAILKVAGMIRRAMKQGDVHMTCGSRKLINWKRAYLLYRRAGWTDELATAMSYYVAVSSREYGEAEKFTLETYRAVCTGPDPARIVLKPADLPGAELDLPDEHPTMRICRPLLDAGCNLWMFGETGAGKTTGAMNHFQMRYGVNPIRMQCDTDTTHMNLVGMPMIRDGNSGFLHAGLPRAMCAMIRGETDARGLPFIIDEPTHADAGTLMTLQAVLEGEPLYIAENGGEIIVPDPGFQIIVGDNTRGLGEAVAYVGTQPVNEAMRDRFYFVELSYSPFEKNWIAAVR